MRKHFSVLALRLTLPFGNWSRRVKDTSLELSSFYFRLERVLSILKAAFFSQSSEIQQKCRNLKRYNRKIIPRTPPWPLILRNFPSNTRISIVLNSVSRKLYRRNMCVRSCEIWNFICNTVTRHHWHDYVGQIARSSVWHFTKMAI